MELRRRNRVALIGSFLFSFFICVCNAFAPLYKSGRQVADTALPCLFIAEVTSLLNSIEHIGMFLGHGT